MRGTNIMLQPLKNRSSRRTRRRRRVLLQSRLKRLRPERYERTLWFRAGCFKYRQLHKMKWYAVDISNRDDDDNHNTTTTTNLFPVSKEKYRSSTLVCLDSTVYCLGGSYRAAKLYTPLIPTFVAHSFDTSCPSPRWKNLIPMNVGRKCPADGKLYVIGGNRVERPKEDPEMERWAEVFDPDTETWTFLPKPPCDDEKEMPSFGFLCEAIEDSHRIFVARHNWKHVYLFDIPRNDWTRYPVTRGHLDACLAHRSDRALSGTTLYWYEKFCSTLYACDLETGKSFSGRLRGLKSAQYKLKDHDFPCETYLFHLAGNLFCLFWGSWPTVHCTKFVVDKTSSGSRRNGSLYAWVLSTQAYQLGPDKNLILCDAVLMKKRCDLSSAAGKPLSN